MSTASFAERYGPWGLVAGASTGSGLALCHEIAARGLGVVMLARDERRLRDRAAEVRSRHGVEVRVLAADLADPAIADRAMEATAGLEIGLLLYNASGPLYGRFLENDPAEHVREVAVNCTAPLLLAHRFAAPMAERRRGGIGLVSSTAAIQGSFLWSSYAAGKAFGWILAESLWTELADHGIDVGVVLSGPIDSEQFRAYQAGFDLELCRRPDSPDPLDRARARLLDPSQTRDVALALLDGLGHGPVHYAHPLDEDVSQACFALPRADAVALKRAYHETPRVDRGE